MKITVLGPWGAYPKAGEATAGYLLEHENGKILIDCGSGVLSRLQSLITLNQLTGVFISHAHYDHIADLGCLQYACLIDTDLERRAQALPIYIAAEHKGMKHAYHTMMGSEVMSFLEKDQFYINGMEFSFFQTFHGAFCLAIKIQAGGKTVVYTADTYYHEALIPFCSNADLLIAETSFFADSDARRYGHMSTTEVGALAAKAGVSTVALTHLPHFGDIWSMPDEVRKQYDGEIKICTSGIQFELK